MAKAIQCPACGAKLPAGTTRCIACSTSLIDGKKRRKKKAKRPKRRFEPLFYRIQGSWFSDDVRFVDAEGDTVLTARREGRKIVVSPDKKKSPLASGPIAFRQSKPDHVEIRRGGKKVGWAEYFPDWGNSKSGTRVWGEKHGIVAEQSCPRPAPRFVTAWFDKIYKRRNYLFPALRVRKQSFERASEYDIVAQSYPSVFFSRPKFAVERDDSAVELCCLLTVMDIFGMPTARIPGFALAYKIIGSGVLE